MATIVMADDDKAFLGVVAKWLGSHGYTVQTARNGQEALALIASLKPDLLVLDVALPLVTGDEIGKDSPLPILYLSGRDHDRVAGLLGPRVRFLQKPADLDEILTEVTALLALS
jgi:DNA-binding response OmpR family regulator